MTSPVRQLAAIMFTDIVGYTALMARNEEEAFALLERNRSIQKPLIEKFGGQFIKEMGDGVLGSFSSSSDAVLCAGTILRAAAEQGIPLRIGMHQGEVLFNDGDVFGDGVNIASRIEPMAEPGQLLVSETIHRNVFNKPGIDTKLIGEKHLKDVREGRKIYSVTFDQGVIEEALHKRKNFDSLTDSVSNEKGRGALLPRVLVRWMIIGFIAIVAGVGIWMSISSSEPMISKELADKRVAVLVFDNPTNDPELEGLGTWAADHITNQLARVEGIKIVTHESVQNHLTLVTDGMNANPEFARVTGADIIIEGRFYLRDEGLTVHANVNDAVTGELIHPFQIQGPREDLSGALDLLSQEILGYWAVKDLPRYNRRPPLFDAYQNFDKGVELYGKGLETPGIEEYLLRAFDLDSSFYAAIIQLYLLYSQTRQPEKASATRELLGQFELEFTPWERARYKAIMTRNRMEWAEAHMERYLVDPNSIGGNYQAAYSQVLGANNPRKSLEILSSFYDHYGNEQDVSWRSGVWILAYYQLGRYQDILSVVDSLNTEPLLGNEYVGTHLSALVQLDDSKGLEYYLNFYRSQTLSQIPDLRYLLYWICNEADLAERTHFINKYATELFEKSQGMDNLSGLFRGAAEYWLGEADNALETFQKIDLDQLPRQGDASGGWSRPVTVKSWIAVCAGELGRDDLVKSVMSEYPNNNYLRAVGHTALNEKQEATSSLEKWIDNFKYPFVSRRLKGDCMLKPLFGYGPFEELVKPIE